MNNKRTPISPLCYGAISGTGNKLNILAKDAPVPLT